MDRAALIAAMGAAVPKPRPVEVPAWGGTVYVRSLTLSEAESLGESPDKRTLARGLAAVLVDEAGTRLFDPDNEDDIRLIGSQSMASLNVLIAAANDGNAATPAAMEKLGNGSTPAKS